MTEAEQMKEMDRKWAEFYREMGFPKLAEYALKYGTETFGDQFMGASPEGEAQAEECLKDGHPMDWYDGQIPEGAIL